jgi:AcrR family transcriptional regulator
MDAAERLIARRGVDNVSLREISAAVGGNVAAVHYYFGSKENLIRATLSRRMAVAEERRSVLLASLDREHPELQSAIEAVVIPYVELSARPGFSNYAPFLSAVDRGGPKWRSLVAESYAAVAPEPVGGVLRAALGHLPDDLAEFRWNLAIKILFEVVGEPQRYSNGRSLTTDEIAELTINAIRDILSPT